MLRNLFFFYWQEIIYSLNNSLWAFQQKSKLQQGVRRVKMIRFFLSEAEYFYKGVMERTAEALQCSQASAGDMLL